MNTSHEVQSIGPFQLSTDREVRKRANEAKYTFFQEHSDAFDSIYDDMVKVRTRMAQKLGFANFVELGYARLNRSDYNAEMVARFRSQVLEHIVPLASKLVERQRERIGLDSMKHYDLPFHFVTGNPTPKGTPEWIVEQGRRMDSELSTETKEFFDSMLDRESLDLLSKKGKDTRGYCTYLSHYQLPYIFAYLPTSMGTSVDIDILTHEAGHAFQVYESHGYQVPEYHFPTSEACEIHWLLMKSSTFLIWRRAVIGNSNSISTCIRSITLITRWFKSAPISSGSGLSKTELWPGPIIWHCVVRAVSHLPS